MGVCHWVVVEASAVAVQRLADGQPCSNRGAVAGGVNGLTAVVQTPQIGMIRMSFGTGVHDAADGNDPDQDHGEKPHVLVATPVCGRRTGLPLA